MKIVFRRNSESASEYRKGIKCKLHSKRALVDYPFSKLDNYAASINIPTIKIVPCIISILGIAKLLQYNPDTKMWSRM